MLSPTIIFVTRNSDQSAYYNVFKINFRFDLGKVQVNVKI